MCRDFANLVLPEKYRTIYRILVKKFLKSGHRSTLNKKFEFTALSSNGSEIPIELAIVPIQIGNHYIFSCFIRDLRRQRELEQEQKEVKEQLIQSQKLESIGQMAGGIAHDFNNILNGVLGHAMLVKKRIPQDDKLSRHLETIIKSCEKGAKLTKDILGFARKGQYELKVLNLNESIAEAINLFSTATNHNVRIETNLDPQLWSVEADSTQILQVFLNLAVNARDAMPQGGLVSIETSNCLLEESEITLLPAGRYVKVSFKDSGTGIPVEIRDRIFDPFFTTKSLGKGTGLGLAMIFGIMKNHGGAIILDTNSSSGALFHLYFPSPEQLESLEISHDFTESNLSKISQADLRGKSVLIVDDELATTSFLTEVFQDNGMETIVANSGEEALGLINSQARFDIAVFDVMMPGMSGTDLYRHLRESRLKMPIIFASGYAENSEIIEIRKADLYVSFLQKPVQIEALLLTVCQQLSPK